MTEEAATAPKLKGQFAPDVPVDELKLHPRNPRIGDVGKIAESLSKHGQARPVVVDKDGVIIAGNHTYKAAKELGWETIDVYAMPYDYEMALSFLVADNRLSDLGTYNDEELLAALNELMEADQLAGTGYAEEDVDDIAAAVGQIGEAAAGTGDPNFTPEATAEHWNRDVEGGPPTTPMKDVSLNYPQEEFDVFDKAVKKLQKEWGVASVRGVVLEAVSRQAGIAKPPPAEPPAVAANGDEPEAEA